MSPIEFVVIAAFRNRFASCNSIHVKRWDVRFCCLDQEKASRLEVHLSEEKIRQDLMSANGNMAFGPGEFPSNWTIHSSQSLEKRLFCCLITFLR